MSTKRRNIHQFFNTKPASFDVIYQMQAIREDKTFFGHSGAFQSM